MEQQPVLGVERNAIRVDGLQAVQSLSVSFAAQARRGLDIVSRDLDPRVYDQADFLAAARQLAVSSRFARIRLLVRDVDAVIKADHRLIEMARRLSSFVEIRRLGGDDAEFNEAFLLADQVGFLRRPVADRWDGEACFNDPLRARELRRVFEGLWQRAVVDPNLRRLHI